MIGGQAVVPARASAGTDRSMVIKVGAAVLLLAIAGVMPVVLGGRGRSSTVVGIEERAEPFDSAAVTSSTPVAFEPPARAYSPLQPAASSALPTTTTIAPPDASVPSATEAPPAATEPTPTTETTAATTETTAAPAAPATDAEPGALAPATAPPRPPAVAPPTPPTATPPPAPVSPNHTLAFQGGTVTVVVDGGTLGLVSARPSARYEAEVRQLGPAALFVRFYGEPGWEDVTIGLGADGRPVSRSTFMPGTVTYDAGY
jgi:hypothetical protein